MVDVNPQQSHITVTVTPTSTTSEITISPSGTSATAGVNYGAEIYAQRAEGYANQASTSATLAGNYATSAQASATEASNSASSALASSTSASNYATTANISMTNASIWAEGTDAEVQELGGEHSAKNWADIAAESAPSATVTKTGTTSTLTVTDIHGTTTVEIENGEKGDTGEPGLPNTLTIGTVEKTTNASASITGTSPNQVLNLGLPKGDTGSTGATGNGIQSITLISTVGLTKTYRITYTDGTTFDYEVKDGASGATQWGGITGSISDQTDLNTALNGKQSTLVSGTNIKTINNTSLLGSGNITIQSAPAIDNSTITQNANQQLQASALVDQRSGISKVWTGTKAQFDAIASKDSNTIYNVTDDYTGNSVAIVQETGNSTSNVMSQKAVTDYAGRQIVYPKTSVFNEGSLIEEESIDSFTQDSLFTASYLVKLLYGTGNYYADSSKPILGLYKDDNNYFAIIRSGYTISIQQKVNGALVHNETYTNYINNINPGISKYFSIDLMRKKIFVKIYTSNSATITDIITFDFSSWDLSSLDTFKIRTSTSMYSGYQSNNYLTINNYVDYTTLMKQQLNYGEYNVFPVISSGDVSDKATLLIMNNVTQTISATHKISTVNLSSDNYFTVGAYNETYGQSKGVYLLSRFKVTDNDTSNPANFGMGACYADYVYNENGELVWNTRKTPRFLPTEDVWYYCITQGASTSGLRYTASYTFRGKGTFTLEGEALWVGYPKNCNLCAETYDGAYFKGSVPMKGVGCAFTKINGGNFYSIIPTYEQTVDANGNVYIWNGTAWKQVSN